MNKILKAALEYQQNGYSVVPILPGAKKPPIKWKEFQTRIASLAEIENWWKRFPKANVAIITGKISGIDCIDADGPFALDNLEGQSGEKLPETVSQSTGRTNGGKHLIYKYHGGGLQNWTGFADNGNDSQCDLRTNGGLFVAAPSIHKSGERYKWIVDPLIEDPEPFPAGIKKFISEWDQKRKQKDSSGEEGGIDWDKLFKDGIPDGKKHQLSFQYACFCIHRNMNFHETVGGLEDIFSRCNPLPREGINAAAVKIATEAFKKFGHQSKLIEAFKKFDAQTPTKTPTTITAKELSNLEIPPIKWAVDGVIAEGLTILAGKPKMGKSLMAMNLCSSVALGGKALGYADCEKGGVLYLALEDVKRRLQSRLNTMLMPDLLAGDNMPDNLHLAFEWPRMGHGGIRQLREKIESIPDIKMVVIDTLKMFRPVDSENKKVYDADYDPISALKKVADDYNIAVVVIHHLRKSAGDDIMDTLSGSFGLTGASDTNAVLDRPKASNADAVLHIVGRDVEATEYALNFSPELMSWNIMGSAADVMRTKQQQTVYDAIKGGCTSPSKVQKETGLKLPNIKKIFKKLTGSDKIRKIEHGKYKVIGLDEPIQRVDYSEGPF
jgi:hypothetical protein